MRSFISGVLVFSSLVTSGLGAIKDSQHKLNTVEDVLSEPNGGLVDGAKSLSANPEALSEPSTVFNGIDVPPMKALSGQDFNTETKDGYWFVKHYSPDCPHCTSIAPTWQTLYEFYYTSNPLGDSTKSSKSQDSLNSFHRYYNFHFASLNCQAFGDTCISHDVESYPTFSLYKDSTFVKKFEATKDMEGLSTFVEGVLESIRPGSRPQGGVKVPKAGQSVSPPESEEEPSRKKEKAKGLIKQDTESTIGKNSTEISKSKMERKKLSKSTAKPNPAGISVALSHESFQKLVTKTQDPWFVKFYAPWCHHCQALAPSWLQMAKKLQDKLNVGEVNCDVEVRLCKDAHVKAYPTLHFFRGGERVEYDGLRGLGDLVNYAEKALDVGSGVAYVDAAAFKEMEETEEVIFLYFYDHATTTEDFEALDRLTLSLIGHAKLVKTDSALLADRFKISTWPRLLVSRDGRPSYYTALAPQDMRDFRQVLGWMQSVWLPIVPELTVSNSKEIMHGKLVVLGILSREAEEFVSAKREIKNAALDWMEKQTHAFQLERQELRDAKQLRLEEAEDRGDQRALRVAKSIQIDITEEDRKQVVFAWADGVFWERWVKTTYGVDVVRDGERVIINDQDNRRYWDVTDSGAYIVPSRTSILETLPRVISNPPKIPSKSTSGAFQQVFFAIRGGVASHPIITLMLLVGAAIGGTWGRGRIRRTRGGFFMLDGKEGLLNGGGYGKAD